MAMDNIRTSNETTEKWGCKPHLFRDSSGNVFFNPTPSRSQLLIPISIPTSQIQPGFIRIPFRGLHGDGELGIAGIPRGETNVAGFDSWG